MTQNQDGQETRASVPADATKALLRLMAWMSPAFPIGGFAYSGGLERAVHDGMVSNGDDLCAWLGTLMRHGSLRTDAVLMAEAWRNFQDGPALADAAELGLALAGSAERHAETLSLGRGFAEAAQAWPCETLDLLPRDLPFPVAVGAIAGGHGIGAQPAVAAFLHAAISQAISASIRLNVCGQGEGLRILARLEPDIESLAGQISQTTLDDLGSATVQADIASLRHETQHSRLFRS